MSAAWVRICRVDDVVPGHPLGRVVGDSGQDRDRVCVVAGADGGPVALLDRCPHRDIALSGGVVRDGTLVCPGHFWRFDLRTGERTDRADRGATLYPTRVVDGWVEAVLPPASPRLPMREWLLAQARATDRPVRPVHEAGSPLLPVDPSDRDPARDAPAAAPGTPVRCADRTAPDGRAD